MGRDYIPGESDAFLGTRDHVRYLGRLARGQIQAVTPEDGRVQVDGIDIPFSKPMTIRPLWFSATPTDPNNIDTSQAKTAWGRYMPMGNEIVKIGYHNDDTPYIVGYDITVTANDEQAGYDLLRTARDENESAGFRTFRDLKPGEYDFKSVGNAYIHGSEAGTLLLAGGAAFIRLNKQDYRIESKASEQKFTSDSSEIRFGSVFRTQNGEDKETRVENVGGSYKEFLVAISETDPTTGSAASQPKARIHFGDVLNNDNTQKQSEANNALRGEISIGDGLNLNEVFSLQIDNQGNIYWTQNTEIENEGLIMRMRNLKLTITNDIEAEVENDATWNVTNDVNWNVQNDFNVNVQNQAYVNAGGVGIMRIDSGAVNVGADSASNQAVLWDPGLRQELDAIKQDLGYLAEDLRLHQHPLPFQSLGIPTGEIFQTIGVKLQPFAGVDAGFKILSPPQKAFEESNFNSGPYKKTEAGNGESNEIDTIKPRSLDGFFRSDYEVGNPSSTILNVDA